MTITWEYDAVPMTGRSARDVAALVSARTEQGWLHLATAAHPQRHGGGTWVYFKRAARALASA